MPSSKKSVGKKDTLAAFFRRMKKFPIHIGAEKAERKIAGYTLKLTCSACPEQYDVYRGKEKVGYIRLRWSHFRVDVPDCGGKTVYEAQIGDGMDGCFDNERQRVQHLKQAVEAIRREAGREELQQRRVRAHTHT